MTNSELYFYNKIKDLDEDYHIIPQVNLAAIIKKEKYTNYYKVNNICIEANIPLITINNLNMSKEAILKLIKTAIEANRAKYKMIKEEPRKTIETKFIIRLIISITLLIVMLLLLFS